MKNIFVMKLVPWGSETSIISALNDPSIYWEWRKLYEYDMRIKMLAIRRAVMMNTISDMDEHDDVF